MSRSSGPARESSEGDLHPYRGSLARLALYLQPPPERGCALAHTRDPQPLADGRRVEAPPIVSDLGPHTAPLRGQDHLDAQGGRVAADVCEGLLEHAQQLHVRAVGELGREAVADYKLYLALRRKLAVEIGCAMRVIAREREHYEVHEVPYGKVYGWRPERVVLERDCGGWRKEKDAKNLRREYFGFVEAASRD